MPIRVLLQTTIPTTVEDWSISRFRLLHDHLSSVRDDKGQPVYEVTSRDREAGPNGDDPVLSRLDESNFDEVWVFAVDVDTSALSDADRAGIDRFWKKGGGVLTARDHQDLGLSLSACDHLGLAHHFHSVFPESDPERHTRDDPYTTAVTWPNYHSGKNGDYQRIEVVEPIHDLMKAPSSPKGVIEYLPAHPHEGAISVDRCSPDSRIVALGHSIVSGREFPIAVATERVKNGGDSHGRSVACSSFHHFLDYNWDPRRGAPSYVSEPPGDTMLTQPRAMADTLTYVDNLARWLAKQ
jgi:hypothetical protein